MVKYKKECRCYRLIEDIIILTEEKREILSKRINLSAWIEHELYEIGLIIDYHRKHCDTKFIGLKI